MAGFHLVGDVHGHLVQLRELMGRLGWVQPAPERDPNLWEGPEGWRLVFVGDLVDRGPDSLGVLQLVRRLVQEQKAHWVVGNHDWRFRGLLRWRLGLADKVPSIPASRQMSWLQIQGLTGPQLRALLKFIESGPLWTTLDEGRLLVAHAGWHPGIPELPRLKQVRACVFGETLPRTEERPADDGYEPTEGRGLVTLTRDDPLPARARWVRGWRGPPLVVWGHEAVRPGQVVRIGDTIAMESGCCHGRSLSALSYPNGRVTQVKSPGHWRRQLHRHAPAESLLYPITTAPVLRRINDEGLQSVDDYLMWLQVWLETHELPPMSVELRVAHRALHARVMAEAQGD